MKLTVAWIGKSKDRAIQELTEKYSERLRHYADFDCVSIKDESKLGNAKSSLILLDSRGKQFSSDDLAEFLRRRREQSPIPLVFAIGGADGFSDELRKSASFILSLGKMTLSHELARVVLLEQLYRAFTILRGHPYHTGH